MTSRWNSDSTNVPKPYLREEDQWRCNRGFRRFIEPGPHTVQGPPKAPFDNICQFVEVMATKWGVEVSFNDTRTRTRTRFSDELLNGARLERPFNQFRVCIFLPAVNICLGQLKTRFESLRSIIDFFSFLFSRQLMKLLEADLEIQVMKLTTVYKTDVSPDLLRQNLAFRACAESFIRRPENPQDILNKFPRFGYLLLSLSYPARDYS